MLLETEAKASLNNFTYGVCFFRENRGDCELRSLFMNEKATPPICGAFFPVPFPVPTAPAYIIAYHTAHSHTACSTHDSEAVVMAERVTASQGM